MRSLRALVLTGALLMAGCGEDEPEPVPTPAPARPAVDTTLGDTASAAGPGATEPASGEAGDTARPAAPDRTAPAAAAGESGPAAAEPAAGERLYTVQVGAFVEAETAREWERRLRLQGMPVWMAMVELGGETFYRLRVGVVPSVEEARRLGRLIGDRYEWPVWIAPVTAADPLPADAAQTTRRLLTGD